LALTEESFNALLDWLDPDRDAAGRKYEVIRTGLIRIFVSRGFSDAEDLADEVVNRVANKLPTFRDNYVGVPARYFHGVARNLLLEAMRRKEVVADLSLLPHQHQASTVTAESECLDECLKQLAENKRELILDYHLYTGHDKISHHQQMADELALSPGALRCQAHHIRVKLQKCVSNCAQAKYNKQNLPSKSYFVAGRGEDHSTSR